jgi:hypothetical protein
MRRAERVVFAFGALGEARQPVLLAQGADAVAPPGQDLVRVALVAHIPDQLVHRGVEDRVDRHGQFDHAQRRAQMPAGFGHGRDHFGAQLIGKAARSRSGSCADRPAATRSRRGVWVGSWRASARMSVRPVGPIRGRCGAAHRSDRVRRRSVANRRGRQPSHARTPEALGSSPGRRGRSVGPGNRVTRIRETSVVASSGQSRSRSDPASAADSPCGRSCTPPSARRHDGPRRSAGSRSLSGTR